MATQINTAIIASMGFKFIFITLYPINWPISLKLDVVAVKISKVFIKQKQGVHLSNALPI